MILIDPQRGATLLSLVGAVAALSTAPETKSCSLPERLVLPGKAVIGISLVMEQKAGSLHASASFTFEGKDSDLSGFSCEDACLLLKEQGSHKPLEKDDAIGFIRALHRMEAESGKAGDVLSWPERALSAFSFFRIFNELDMTVESLPAGIGTEGNEDVISIASEYRIPLKGIPSIGTRTTTSGLLILARSVIFRETLPSFIPIRQALGTDPEGGCVRAILTDNSSKEEIWIVEASMDDATGEEIGRALEQIQSVSLEAHILQGMGKKGRPLFILRALAASEQLDDVLDRFFRDTPTIGVRYWPVGRTRMRRETKEGQLVVDGISLPTRIKISRLGEIIRGKAEADDMGTHLYGTSLKKGKKRR